MPVSLSIELREFAAERQHSVSVVSGDEGEWTPMSPEWWPLDATLSDEDRARWCERLTGTRPLPPETRS